MKRFFLICAILAYFSNNTSAQEDAYSPEGVVESAPFNTGSEESFAPLELTPLIDDMGWEIPSYGELPEVDREYLEALQRKLFADMPRYPVLKLWDNQLAYPFLYSSRNRYMGLDMAGIGTSFQFTNWLSADVSAYLSGAYMGQQYPKRYMNASLSGTVKIKLHDRVYLVGMGEISAREGLHPKVAPCFGGKNSLGAGVEIWITEKFGVTFSRTWEYYQGSWYGHYGYGPIGR